MQIHVKGLCASAVVVAALVGVTAKADAKVSVVQSTSPALARGSSFAWAPIEGVAIGVRDPSLANPIVGERLERAIEGSLTARGYRQAAAPRAADLLVSYRVVLDPRRELQVDNRGGRAACGWRGCVGYPSSYSVSPKNYTQGTLVLDLVEQRTGRLVWRAVSDQRVTAKDASAEKLNKLLASMTKSLPAA